MKKKYFLFLLISFLAIDYSFSQIRKKIEALHYRNGSNCGVISGPLFIFDVKSDTSLWLRATNQFHVIFGGVVLPGLVVDQSENVSGSVRISNSEIKNLGLIGNGRELDVAILSLDSDEVIVVNFRNLTINASNKIEEIKAMNGSFITIENCMIRKDSYLSADSIKISSIKFMDDAVLRIVATNTSDSLRINFTSQPNDLNHFDFDCKKASVLIDGSLDRSKFLRDLLEMQIKHNYAEGIKNVDLEYKKYTLSTGNLFFKYIVLPIRTYWDNFGYNKELIFRSTMILFTFFLMINLICFVRIYEDVYPIESLKIHYEKIFPLRTPYDFLSRTFPYSLYFTIVVFFGLKMNLDILKLDHKGWAFYLYAQYVIGLICLGYLVNYVISN